jgi:hypothetical protein
MDTRTALVSIVILVLGIVIGGVVGGYIGYDIGFERSVAESTQSIVVQPESSPSPTWDQDYFDYIHARFENEYNAKVILLGGLGSQQVQKSAYVEGGNAFLTPTEDWVNTSFTRAGAIWVNCRDGYTVAACGVNNAILDDAIDPQLGCYYEAQQLREDIEVKCVESN